MTTLDGLFAKPASLHPRLRYWKDRLDEPGISARVEVSWPRSEIGQSDPEMYLHFTDRGKPLHSEMRPWDDDLNAGLIQPLRVTAINPENEAVRFTLGLRAALRKASRDFGDGYFNAVLLDLIRDSDLTHHPEIAEVIEHAPAYLPHKEGGPLDRYTICRELIADAISGRARELTGPLGYSQDEAKQILVSAIARYLDERFSVSSRRRFGLL